MAEKLLPYYVLHNIHHVVVPGFMRQSIALYGEYIVHRFIFGGFALRE